MFSSISPVLRHHDCSQSLPAAVMHKFKILVVATVWALPSACLSLATVTRDAMVTGTCPGRSFGRLGEKLSDGAEIYFPGSTEFDAATLRWSSLDTPKVNVVVVPATENDVALTVGCFRTWSWWQKIRMLLMLGVVSIGQIRK